ncbi:hypothetical protein B7486_13360 [cyanobacterium TDX16]|nr:hypothetical protein B7486_13360 [cyanobacterium TDX16]
MLFYACWPTDLQKKSIDRMATSSSLAADTCAMEARVEDHAHPLPAANCPHVYLTAHGQTRQRLAAGTWHCTDFGHRKKQFRSSSAIFLKFGNRSGYGGAICPVLSIHASNAQCERIEGWSRIPRNPQIFVPIRLMLLIQRR